MKIALKNMLVLLNALHNKLKDPAFSCTYMAVNGHAFPAFSRFPLEALEEAVESAGLIVDGNGFECDMVPFKRLLGLLQNLHDCAKDGLTIDVQDMAITGTRSTAGQLTTVEINMEDNCDMVVVKIRWPHVMEDKHALQMLSSCSQAANFALGTFHYEKLSEEDAKKLVFFHLPRGCFRRPNAANPEEDLWFGSAFFLPCIDLYDHIKQLLAESDCISRKLAHIPDEFEKSEEEWDDEDETP